MLPHLPEEENQVHRGPLSKGNSRVSGLGASCSWYLSRTLFSNSVSCPFSLVSSFTYYLLPRLSDAHLVGRQVLYLPGCRCVRLAVFWGTLREI